MALTERTLGLLVDLVENKMTSMQIADREDAREFVGLQRCLAELRSSRGMPAGQSLPESSPKSAAAAVRRRCVRWRAAKTKTGRPRAARFHMRHAPSYGASFFLSVSLSSAGLALPPEAFIA